MEASDSTTSFFLSPEQQDDADSFFLSRGVGVQPTPATHAILTVVKAGETVCQADTF